jgi:hypothetical protein
MRASVLALAMASMPFAAEAQYAPCPPNLLALPFCAAGAIVVGAATIVTAPFWLLGGGAPPYYRGYGYPVPVYYPPPAYPPPPPMYYPQPVHYAPPPSPAPASAPPMYYAPRG